VLVLSGKRTHDLTRRAFVTPRAPFGAVFPWHIEATDNTSWQVELSAFVSTVSLVELAGNDPRAATLARQILTRLLT